MGFKPDIEKYPARSIAKFLSNDLFYERKLLGIM
jgi:hypothetical protein